MTPLLMKRNRKTGYRAPRSNSFNFNLFTNLPELTTHHGRGYLRRVGDTTFSCNVLGKVGSKLDLSSDQINTLY